MLLFTLFLLLPIRALPLPVPGNGPIEGCPHCTHTTWSGSTVTRTLLYHTYCKCTGTRRGTCIHNQSTYFVCDLGNDQPYICYYANSSPYESIWFEVYVRLKEGTLLTLTKKVPPSYRGPNSLYFDACQAAYISYSYPVVSCDGLSWERYYSNCHKYICTPRRGSFQEKTPLCSLRSLEADCQASTMWSIDPVESQG